MTGVQTCALPISAFEFVTDRLGAQGTVLGGGRYDGLMETLGGPHTPAVGWAAGIERLAMLVGEVGAEPEDRAEVAIIPDRGVLEAHCYHWAAILRRAGISTEISFRGNAKRRAEVAQKRGAKTLLFLRVDGFSLGGQYLKNVGSDDNVAEITLRIEAALVADIRSGRYNA